MAATRKLQGEIERCLKKVDEGVETFEDTWQKVHNATNSNQKEKYEADLKKEIKKLQRLRDQIKSWIASPEIKDKSALLDHRKLIETLDTFESEIESMLVGKKKRLDKDKQERIDDLKYRIRKIKDDIEYYIDFCSDPDFEDNDFIYDDIIGLDEIELGVTLPSTTDSNDGGSPTSLVSMSPSMPMAPLSTSSPPPAVRPASSSSSSLPSSLNNNSALGSNPSSESSCEEGRKRVSSGSASVSSSKQQALEEPSSAAKPVRPTAVRATNSNPTPLAAGMNSLHSSATKLSNAAPAKSLPGSTAHTTPNNSSPSSGLLASQIAGNFAAVAAASSCTNGTNSQVGTGKSASVLPSLPTALPQQPQQQLLQQPVMEQQMQQPPPQLQQNQQMPHSQQQQQPSHQQTLVSTSPIAPVTPVGPQLQMSKAMPNSYAVTSSSPSPLSTSSVPSPQPLAPGPIGGSSFAMLRPLQQQQQPPSQAVQQQVPQHHSASQVTPVLMNTLSNIKTVGGQSSSAPSLPMVNGPLMSKVPDGMSSLKVIAQQVIDRAGLEVPFAEPNRAHQQAVSSVAQLAANSSASMLSSAVNAAAAAAAASVLPSSILRNSPPHTAEAHIPPLLGVAPLGPVPLQKEHQFQLQMLEAAYYHMPHPSDSEKLRPYLPRNPCVLPPYYPQVLCDLQTLLLHSDTVEFFQRLATESLFFIFYYMEGTKAQYLAAKALKKQSWRFHTKYMMWFQRHEEPKIINEEFEQGTYIYFDYEKWGQRKKEGFTFEYKYLEDRELN
ncbi:hypothetical protein B566_EDAN002827 [Ephemera danica]|nr:hypothetical protein B566_EDAN002827 [Ephemera danica]